MSASRRVARACAAVATRRFTPFERLLRPRPWALGPGRICRGGRRRGDRSGNGWGVVGFVGDDGGTGNNDHVFQRGKPIPSEARYAMTSSPPATPLRADSFYERGGVALCLPAAARTVMWICLARLVPSATDTLLTDDQFAIRRGPGPSFSPIGRSFPRSRPDSHPGGRRKIGGFDEIEVEGRARRSYHFRSYFS